MTDGKGKDVDICKHLDIKSGYCKLGIDWRKCDFDACKKYEREEAE